MGPLSTTESVAASEVDAITTSTVSSSEPTTESTTTTLAPTESTTTTEATGPTESTTPTTTESTTTTTTTTTTTGSTTTTTEAPVGKNRTFEFTSSVPGLVVKISFVQLEGNTLEMHCDVKTDPSATETLDRFCSTDTRPKIYLIEGYEDCSTLPPDGFVDGQMVAELDKPNEYDIQTPPFTFNALEGNCLVIMQE